MEPNANQHVSCNRCATLLDVTSLTPFSRVECPDCGETFRVKTQFGPYRLTRRHAIGGMSMVFAADDGTLEREVAIKVLSDTYCTDERRISAFEHEAKITASLSHPNIVRVFKTGRAYDRYYIAMEMVPGGHLEEQIRSRGKIPEAEVLAWATEVAMGLQAAHRAGLIHRDVKPGNILMDAEGHARLVDFGLALVTQGGKATASEIWATPYYVPPEAIDGHAEDFRSDIYAFGSSLYHALCGEPPCSEQSLATDQLKTEKRNIIPIGKRAPELTALTCSVIDRCMAYGSNERYQSYDDLIADLKKAQSALAAGISEPVQTATNSGIFQSRKNLLLGATTACALAVLLLVFLVMKRNSTPENDPSEAITTVNPEAAAPTETPRAASAIDPYEAAEIARLHNEARKALDDRQFDAAAKAFFRLFMHPRVPEPTRGWAAVESVITSALTADNALARSRASIAREHMANHPSSHPFAQETCIKLLANFAEFPALQAPDLENPASQVIACMLAGMKNWEQGMLNEAVDCFRRAASLQLDGGGSNDWLNSYQQIARDYLADFAVLSDPVFSKSPTRLEEFNQAIARLDELEPQLIMPGRGKHNLDSWRGELRVQAKHLARRISRE